MSINAHRIPSRQTPGLLFSSINIFSPCVMSAMMADARASAESERLQYGWWAKLALVQVTPVNCGGGGGGGGFGGGGGGGGGPARPGMWPEMHVGPGLVL